MNDIDDLEFGSKKTRNVRTGRRARRDETEEVVDDGGAVEESLAASDDVPNKDVIVDGPPRPSRRVGGWEEESTTKRSRFSRRRGMEDLEDERLRPHSPDKDDSDNDIPVIPDLEDQQDEEDMTTQIAVAPTVAVNRVATYRELDNDLLRHAAFLTLDNEVDLKLLTRCLSSEVDVIEEDKSWEWDRLFTEVTSELLTEWEAAEDKEEEAEET